MNKSEQIKAQSSCPKTRYIKADDGLLDDWYKQMYDYITNKIDRVNNSSIQEDHESKGEKA